MFQSDYMMRLIEFMTAVFARALKLRQEKKFQQAYEALDDLLDRLSLPRRHILKALSVSDVVELLTSRGVTEADKLLAVAKVLKEEADIASDEGDGRAAAASRIKAIRLYAETVRLCRLQRTDLPARDELDAWLSDADRRDWNADVCVSLAHAYEAYGRYAQAEDRWFDALYRAPDDATVYEQGLRFYERLLETDAERLTQGDLPEAEVREGLEAFRTSFGTHASE